MSFSSREHAAITEVRDALGSSLCLREVMQAAQPQILRLLGGDHTALGFAQGGGREGIAGAAPEPQPLEWLASDGLPPAFFGEYARLAAHDFVLKAVMRRPRTALPDSEMVSRRVLEANPLHNWAWELGVPLQQVMAVMLDVGELSSGLAVYRQSKRPFRDRERALLQALVPALAHAVRNCLVFEGAERRARVLETVLANRDRAVIVFDAWGAELFRTQHATRLLEKWLGGAREGAAEVPEPLLNDVRRWRARVGDTTPSSFSRSASQTVLMVTPEWIADAGRVLLALELEEHPKPPWSAAAWARLTPRQLAVVAGVMKGWDNQLIASELGCRLATVKRHLTQIFDTLGIGSRTQLMAAAPAPRRS